MSDERTPMVDAFAAAMALLEPLSVEERPRVLAACAILMSCKSEVVDMLARAIARCECPRSAP